jgi:hypothetical protein
MVLDGETESDPDVAEVEVNCVPAGSMNWREAMVVENPW